MLFQSLFRPCIHNTATHPFSFASDINRYVTFFLFHLHTHNVACRLIVSRFDTRRPPYTVYTLATGPGPFSSVSNTSVAPYSLRHSVQEKNIHDSNSITYCFVAHVDPEFLTCSLWFQVRHSYSVAVQLWNDSCCDASNSCIVRWNMCTGQKHTNTRGAASH